MGLSTSQQILNCHHTFKNCSSNFQLESEAATKTLGIRQNSENTSDRTDWLNFCTVMLTDGRKIIETIFIECHGCEFFQKN